MLRCSFASFADDLGCNEPTMPTLLGHNAHSIPSRYVHSADAVLLAPVDAVVNATMNLMGPDADPTPVQERVHLPSDRHDIGSVTRAFRHHPHQVPDQVWPRSYQPADRLCRHHVKLPMGDALEQGIQSRPPVASLGAASSFVPVAMAITITVQPNRLAASRNGCNWFPMAHFRSLVETRHVRVVNPMALLAARLSLSLPHLRLTC
jgi:hypothetical protein